MYHQLGSLDCDLRSGKCPSCGYENLPHVRRNCPAKRHLKPLPYGTGSELKSLFDSLGIKEKRACGCGALCATLNRLGPAGCREHREEVLAKLRENYELYGMTDKLKAAWAAVTSGLAWEMEDWSDPLASLLELAIRRAELSTPSPPPQSPTQ